MIQLYRTFESPLADDIEAGLQEIRMAHEVVVVDSQDSIPHETSGAALPLVVDGDDVVSGKEALETYIEEQQQLMKDWYSVQSGACHVEDDGTIC